MKLDGASLPEKRYCWGVPDPNSDSPARMLGRPSIFSALHAIIAFTGHAINST
jgi:hypothetical protein